MGPSKDARTRTINSVDRDDESLIVDLAAPQPVGESELRAWAADQRVFISSVMGGMTEERLAVAQAVDRIGATPVWFERFGGRDDDPEEAFLAEVARSDVYVGVLGERYGTPLRSGYSATHAEYREAIERGLRMCVWALSGSLAGPQRDFLNEVRVFRTTGAYATAEELGSQVEVRLKGLAAEALSPWVKVGRAVFRARNVTHDGKALRIEARVRDDGVIAALEALRPGGAWSGPQDSRVTWAGRTEFVSVKAIETSTSAGRGCALTLVAEKATAPSGRLGIVDMAVSGLTPEELTEIAVRVALFGEPNPMKGSGLGFMVKMTNPFPIIEAARLPEDSVTPVAHLLLTEELLSTGRADRVTSLQVGPKRADSRRVVLRWLPRRRFSNATPIERQVDGDVVVATHSD